jgi:hypothetical protein
MIALGAYSDAQAQQEALCFEETGYCISGRIREFWENNGGLPVFGYPITQQRPEAIEGEIYQVQWFERERLELHPENARPYDVLLGRLGVDRLEQQDRDWREFSTENAEEDCLFFPQTQQNVCGAFLQAWRSDGLEIDGEPGKSYEESLALFGLPLSPPVIEEIEGNDYVVQWFERARFESHPENDPPYNVLFGLLGNEVRSFEEGEEDDDDGDNGDDTTATPTTTPEPAEPETLIAFASSREGDREIFTMNPDGSNVINRTDHPSIDGTPAWSPDGTKIAFGSERDGNREIYVMDADGSDLQRLTNNSADDWNPAWSPDGWRIAFESDRNGDREIYVMGIDGSNQENLTNNDADDWSPAWSPDSDQIVFQSDRDTFLNIYVMNDDGTRQRALTDNESNDERPAWSPDGEQIAFDSDRDGNREIYVMDTDGSNPERLTSNSADDRDPDWSPDGEQIVFRSERDGNAEIHTMDADGRNVENITTDSASDRDPAWSPVLNADELDAEDDE